MTETMGLSTRSSERSDSRDDADRNRFLTFNLGKDVLAMDIRAIKEVIQYAEITEVPLVPPAIRGVINLRGAVVPVIDLAVRFGGAPTEIARRTCVVIVEMEQQAGVNAVLGVVVDQVREVLEVPPEDIEPPPAFGSQIRLDFILGVGKVKGQFILLLDVNRVFSIEELSSLNNGKTQASV
jgi:purine-binding chemotaxis protein CheW